MWCAMAVGTREAVKAYCIKYANERTAFGEPISHRQSVAFMIADMAIEIDAMRMLILNAVSLAEAGKPFHREAYLARILCAEKSMKIGTDGVQILGGHGFTKNTLLNVGIVIYVQPQFYILAYMLKINQRIFS